MPQELQAPFDREAVRQEIIERFKAIKRRPGDPRLRVELSESVSLSPSLDCPPAELDRRHRMQDFHVFVKVVVNAKEVSRTRAASLQRDFSVLLNELFPLKLVSWPSSIILQVWEANPIHGEIFVSEVFAALPPTSAIQSNTTLDTLEFASDHVLRFEYGSTSRVSSDPEIRLM